MNRLENVLKKIALFMVTALLAVIVCGTALSGTVRREDRPVFDSLNSMTGDLEEGGLVLEENAEGGIGLCSQKIALADYEEYGISAQAETAYTLMATVESVSTSLEKVDWAVTFQNPSGAWANGKKASDYVRVTPSSDGSTVATAQALKAFGERIVITVTSRTNPVCSATCIANYAPRVLDLLATFTSQTGGQGAYQYQHRYGSGYSDTFPSLPLEFVNYGQPMMTNGCFPFDLELTLYLSDNTVDGTFNTYVEFYYVPSFTTHFNLGYYSSRSLLNGASVQIHSTAGNTSATYTERSSDDMKFGGLGMLSYGNLKITEPANLQSFVQYIESNPWFANLSISTTGYSKTFKLTVDPSKRQ